VVERRREDQQDAARAAVAAAVEAAQAALSLPSLLLDQDSDSLCQVGWRVVREIEERCLKRNAHVRVRVHFPVANLLTGGLRGTVYLNGSKLGEVGLQSGYDLEADLCCGSHYLAVDGSGSPGSDTGRGMMVIPGEGNYHVEVQVKRMLRTRVAQLYSGGFGTDVHNRTDQPPA
jgi:hypothetical protein